MASNLKTLTCDDYHVAWICAVADVEQLPACLMLDEEHTTPTYDTHYDENVYTCGSINGHTVVIATCSQGETGNVNAGHLAQALFKTFRNIRMALLVGIGGGIPKADISENPLKNIHLGDVVVGFPGDGSPGCVYYERGRAKDNGGFELVGAVQNPDFRLTQALAKVAMDYKRKRVDFDKHLARLRDPDLGSEFARPRPEHDRLFEAAYSPEGGHMSGCATCDESKLVRRPERTEEFRARLVYHQGRIATGNAVIRSAKLRDEISLRCDGALCVEMEAAGVDVNRRCLVIRGISDYADCHKSDVWQSYAAGNAAVFARELLCRVQPAAVREMEATVVKAPWLVPLPRPQSFVGRSEPLEQLSAYLSSEGRRRLAIYGLGGCGKTALALEIAYRTRQEKPKHAIFWVSAVDRDNFEQAYRDIAKLLCIPGIEDLNTDIKRVVKEKLEDERFGPWLMVIDNADDIDILLKPLTDDEGAIPLIDYVPKLGNGSIVFTTRTKKVAIDLAGTDLIQLDRLSESEAIGLLKTRLLPEHLHQLKDMTITQTFLETLAFHTLAIVQAIAFVNKNSTLSEYLKLYRANEQSATYLISEEFEDQGRYRSIKNAVATTWAISFLHIQKQDQLAAEYLQFMACVLNNNISESMLPSTAPPVDHAKAIATLKAYAFITVRQHQVVEEASQLARSSFDIHPLVHIATRKWLEGRSSWCSCVKTAAQQMQNVLPYGDVETRETWTPYLNHASHVCKLLYASQKELWANLIDRIGDCHNTLGQYKAMEQCYRELLVYQKETLAERHANTLRSLHSIGQALAFQGNYNEAEKMYRKTLALRKEVLGVEDPETLRSMQNLAWTITEQGRYGEAEKLQRARLALSLKVNGEKHPDTLLSMRAVASLSNHRGNFAEAEELSREVIDLQIEVLGPEHRQTLTSMNNLALVLQKQGRYTEAEALQRQILELNERIRGKVHPETLTSMNNLGATSLFQRKYTEAEQLLREVVELRQRIIGSEHPYTLVSLNNLAQALGGQTKNIEAERLHRRVLAARERLLGKEHPDTLRSRNNLAAILCDLGEYGESEEMHRITLKLEESVLGLEHPETLTSVDWVAGVLRKQGRYQESLRFYERALRGREKVLGPNHPDTQATASWRTSVQKKIRMQSPELGDSLVEQAQDSGTASDSAELDIDYLAEEDGSADEESEERVPRSYASLSTALSDEQDPAAMKLEKAEPPEYIGNSSISNEGAEGEVVALMSESSAVHRSTQSRQHTPSTIVPRKRAWSDEKAS